MKTLFFEKVLFYLAVFLFAFIPLYPKFPFFNIASTFVAVRIEDLIIASFLSLWVIYLGLAGRIKEVLVSRLTLAVLLFFAIGALSSFSAIFLTQSVVWHLSILHFLRRVEFMMLLLPLATIVRTKKQFAFILIELAFVLLAVNIYALGQQFLHWPVISTTNSEFSKGLILTLTPGARVNSTFAGHYDLAVFLAMSITIITALYFAVKKSLKVLCLGLGALSSLVLVMTAARLSFVAAFVGIITALLFARRKKYILFIVFAVLAILIYPSQLRDRLTSTVTVNLFQQGQRYEGTTEDQKTRSQLNIPTLAIKTSSESAETSTFATESSNIATDITPGEPVDTTQLGVYRSFQIRLQIEWPRAIAAFLKNPFLGTGYSSQGLAVDNDFLRSLAEVGLLGTLAFGLILLEIVKRIYLCFKNESKIVRFFSAGVLAMMLTFLVNGLFIDVFEASKVASLFWMVLGLSLATNKFK